MSEKIEIHVPNLGGVSDVEILEIFLEPGNPVNKEDPLLSLETDKAVMEVPCPEDGILESFTVKVGDTISEGDLIGYLQPSSSGNAEAAVKEAATPEQESPKHPEGDKQKAESNNPDRKMEAEHRQSESRSTENIAADRTSTGAKDFTGHYHASPSVRKFARELGADLTQVTGTAPKGRITRQDVEGWIKERLSRPAAAGGSINALPPVNPEEFKKLGEIKEEKLTKIKQITGKRLQASWQNIPHVTHFDEADITDLEEFRKELNQQHKDIKVTPLAFIIKAAVKALQEYPRFNSSINSRGDILFLKNYYNIGFAADTPDGLMVPVIHNADQKGIRQIAQELMETSSKARDKKLEPQKLSGGTFTISSLGGIGGTQFTPVINPPEAAIMGVSRSKWTPVWTEGKFEARLILPFSLSYDHRIIDGAEAARFCRLVAEILTDFRLSAL